MSFKIGPKCTETLLVYPSQLDAQIRLKLRPHNHIGDYSRQYGRDLTVDVVLNLYVSYTPGDLPGAAAPVLEEDLQNQVRPIGPGGPVSP